ncbi:hypothetical protein KVMX100_240059 [Klebsiella variicola]|nr:hypothetical protein KVMX100_240059 [Klebsiella variicola]
MTSSHPLNKIALSVGYSDPVWFSRLFRKHIYGKQGLKTSTAPIGSRLLPTTYCYVSGYAISVCRRNT